MICYFKDHTTFHGDEKELAKSSLAYKKAELLAPESGISLITCHRIEYYIPSTIDPSLIRKNVEDFEVVTDSIDVFFRLFSIALGLKSIIIGENAVIEQVENSVRPYLQHHPLDFKMLNLVKIARKIRDRFDFYSPNHGQLVYRHVSKQKNDTLILFGAGLLNQTILSSIQPQSPYKKIIVVTRDKKKARKKLSGIAYPIEILKIDDLKAEYLGKSFDVIIATDGMSSQYAKKVVEICRKEECQTVADLSSSPIATLEFISKIYLSLYSKNMEELILNNNFIMEKKRIALEDYLKKLDPKFWNQKDINLI